MHGGGSPRRHGAAEVWGGARAELGLVAWGEAETKSRRRRVCSPGEAPSVRLVGSPLISSTGACSPRVPTFTCIDRGGRCGPLFLAAGGCECGAS
eukprot:9487519-Pyramimonas_sp.AAC.1